MSSATPSSSTDFRSRPGDPRAAERRVERMARWLGLAGLVPFVVGTIGVWMFRHPFDSMALGAQMTYGAVILAFLGAVHWGLVLRMPFGAPPALLVWGVMPSLVGWAALAFGPPLQHGVMMLGFLAAFAADRRVVLSGFAPPWYGRLRLMLTTAVLLLVAGSGLRYIVYPLVDAYSLVPAAAEGIPV